MRQPLVPGFPRSDRWLWLAAIALTALGVLMVHSAALEAPPHPRLSASATRQLVFIALGTMGMVVVARADYRQLQRAGAWIYVAAALLLVTVLIGGTTEYGARRWLSLGVATFQPSELAKLALAVALAAYAAERRPAHLAVGATLALCGALGALVLLEPDLGTTLVIGAIWLGIVFAWGASWRLLGTLLAVAAAIGPLLFALLVPAYQRERLVVFFDASHDPLGSGFNLRQAEVALGSGGLTGRGLFGGAESQLSGVAARSSDFVFALVGEELGLLGGTVVLVLLATVVWRGFAAARTAPDRFGRLLAVGLTTMFMAQAVLNVAVAVRLFPATGIPLPFIAAGGTSTVTTLLAIGLLQSIASRHPPSAREQWRAERWM